MNKFNHPDKAPLLISKLRDELTENLEVIITCLIKTISVAHVNPRRNEADAAIEMIQKLEECAYKQLEEEYSNFRFAYRSSNQTEMKQISEDISIAKEMLHPTFLSFRRFDFIIPLDYLLRDFIESSVINKVLQVTDHEKYYEDKYCNGLLVEYFGENRYGLTFRTTALYEMLKLMSPDDNIEVLQSNSCPTHVLETADCLKCLYNVNQYKCWEYLINNDPSFLSTLVHGKHPIQMLYTELLDCIQQCLIMNHSFHQQFMISHINHIFWYIDMTYQAFPNEFSFLFFNSDKEDMFPLRQFMEIENNYKTIVETGYKKCTIIDGIFDIVNKYNTTGFLHKILDSSMNENFVEVYHYLNCKGLSEIIVDTENTMINQSINNIVIRDQPVQSHDSNEEARKVRTIMDTYLEVDKVLDNKEEDKEWKLNVMFLILSTWPDFTETVIDSPNFSNIND